MKMQLPFRRHAPWSELASAYTDDELDPRARERFQRHLAGCRRCQDEVAGLQAVKGLVRTTLPQRDAPRSFALTDAMLASPRPLPVRPPAGRQLAFMARAAQVATAATVAGLAVLLVVDASSSGSGKPRSDNGTGAEATSSQFGAPGSASQGAPSSDTPPAAADSAAAPPATQAPQPGGVSSAGFATPPAEPSAQPQRNSQEDKGVQATAQSSQLQTAPAAGFRPPADESDDGRDNLRTFEVALAFVAAGSLVTWLAIRRRPPTS
jgi:hypothetical protein